MLYWEGRRVTVPSTALRRDSHTCPSELRFHPAVDGRLCSISSPLPFGGKRALSFHFKCGIACVFNLAKSERPLKKNLKYEESCFFSYCFLSNVQRVDLEASAMLRSFYLVKYFNISYSVMRFKKLRARLKPL